MGGWGSSLVGTFVSGGNLTAAGVIGVLQKKKHDKEKGEDGGKK